MQYSSWEDRKRHEVAWAVSILEAPQRYEAADYRATLLTASIVLRNYGYNEWEQAKAWLCPGWAPHTVTEVYL